MPKFTLKKEIASDGNGYVWNVYRDNKYLTIALSEPEGIEKTNKAAESYKEMIDMELPKIVYEVII